MKVSVYSTGGKNQQRYTNYEVGHPPAGPDVTMTKQGAMSNFFGSIIGRKDVLIGDPLFDNRVIVSSDDEAAAREFLTPARQAAVQEVLSIFDQAEIRHDRIRVPMQGVSSDSTKIAATVRRLIDIASILGDVRFNAIGSAGRPGVISNEVQAVFEFDAGTALHAGNEVRFRGVLTNVDRFSRKIWVRHATQT